MKKILFLTSVIFIANLCVSQNNDDTLYLHYYTRSPFSYSETNEVKGIEPDIMREYTAWLRNKKKIFLRVKYLEYANFSDFYSEVKGGDTKNTLGMGSVIINAERAKEIDFTTAYIKNVAFCVTNGNALNIKAKTPEEIVKTLGSMTALTITNTPVSACVNDLKKTYIKDLKISYLNDETQILNKIAGNPLNFGFIDAVIFWNFLKNNPSKSLKMQKPLNQANELMGFVMPKGSRHKALFNEFFASFKASVEYREILEKHLGTFMAQNMAAQ